MLCVNINRPCDIDLLTLKVVGGIAVSWGTFLPILMFLQLSVREFWADRCQVGRSRDLMTFDLEGHGACG